jgi:phosphoribosylaminoimidazole-succinocarboxamide synthase
MTPLIYQTEIRSLPLLFRGKVRDMYAVDDRRMLIVATDRLSAFDVVLPDPIPGKGEVLTRLSNFWCRRLAHVVPNHLTGDDPEACVPDPAERAQVRGRAVVVWRLRPLPVEAIVRGYLAGSGWKEYRERGTVCDIPLPPGLKEASRLPEPLFTPSTKAAQGLHDENITFARVVELVGRERAEAVRAAALTLYTEAVGYALGCGIIIADTKFEFGLDDSGRLVLIDEVLTPDSSRFWPADQYAEGQSPPSFDKQYVRDWLEATGWDKRPPAPRLPAEVIARTAAKYREALVRLTGEDLAASD